MFKKNYLIETGVSHDPPSNLVMKEGYWPVTPEMVTTLFDKSGEVNIQLMKNNYVDI